MAPEPEMSSATKEVLARVRQMVPPMLEKFHKGVYLIQCAGFRKDDILWNGANGVIEQDD